MSNELNNIIARTTDGVCEGVAIGGDRWGSAVNGSPLFKPSVYSNCRGLFGPVQEYLIANVLLHVFWQTRRRQSV